MTVGWYDEVRLKDGREGCVIEIYEHPNGNGYEIELSPEPNASETITVRLDDIETVIWQCDSTKNGPDNEATAEDN